MPSPLMRTQLVAPALAIVREAGGDPIALAERLGVGPWRASRVGRGGVPRAPRTRGSPGGPGGFWGAQNVGRAAAGRGLFSRGAPPAFPLLGGPPPLHSLLERQAETSLAARAAPS